MQVGKLIFQLDQDSTYTGNVARTVSTDAYFLDRIGHGANHQRVALHSETISRPPNNNFTRARGQIPDHIRTARSFALTISVNTLTLFPSQPLNSISENLLGNHSVEGLQYRGIFSNNFEK